MNATLRNVLVSSSLVLLMWTGCSGEDGGDPTSSSSSSSSTSGPTSTGTGPASSSVASSTGPTSSSTGAGASGPGCDDIPPFPPGPSNGECIPGYGNGAGGGGQGGGGVGGGQGGGGVGGAGQGGGVGGGGIPPAFAECNPVSQEGCNTQAGAECDLESGGTFTCFPSGNTEPACAACNNGNGPWCQPGMHCNEGVCRRYCCDDSDCGPSLTCNKMVATFMDVPPVGLCLP